MTCSNSEIILWNLTTGEEMKRLFVPDGGKIIGALFSPDGKTALSAHDGGLAIYWDIDSGEVIREIKPPSGIVRDVAFSPDGQMALTAGMGANPTILWDLLTGEPVHTMQAGVVTGVKFTANGRFALMVGKRVSLWNSATGEEIRRYAEEGFYLAPIINLDEQSFFVNDTSNSIIRRFRIDWGDELVNWTLANCYVRDLTCTERELYRIEPLCE